jgi:UDP-4-amino-4,6-dideoxy-N-acetyl-beta-L-altrosamine transaminase
MAHLPYARQSISEEDIAAVVAVLRSDWLTQGPTIQRFEERVAKYCGARFGVAMSSATAALHLSCHALGLGHGDTLWTSPNTFVASANCALYCGAGADFVDIDPRTYNLSVEALETKLEEAQRSNVLPKAVEPVHFGGQSCDMAEIAALAKHYRFSVIEDASHAIGGTYRGRPVGSCEFSDIAVFSFHPAKIITTGEGGMALTNRPEIYEKLLMLRTHGITRDERRMTGPSHGPWYYQQTELGFNYRITDIQAALGISQLDRIDPFVRRRRDLAARYDHLLAGLPVTLPGRAAECESSWHLYVIRLQPGKMRRTHKEVFEALRGAGIGVNLHYIPVHTQPYYQRLGFKVGDFPEAERYYSEAITLPLFYEMSEADQDRVVQELRRSLSS